MSKNLNQVQYKALMQEPVIRSKTRRNIVYAVTSHVKFQSQKIKKQNIQRKKRLSFH